MTGARRFLRDGWNVLGLLIAGIPLGFGIVCALPNDLFGASPGFRFMRDLMPEPAWATISILCGLVGLVGLTTRDRRTACVIALALSAWHNAVALSVALANPVSTAFTTYGLLAIAGYCCAWNALRGR